jgi:hypothetical protein
VRLSCARTGSDRGAHNIATATAMYAANPSLFFMVQDYTATSALSVGMPQSLPLSHAPQISLSSVYGKAGLDTRRNRVRLKRGAGTKNRPPRCARMVQIKGSAIKETISQIKSRAGEQAFQKILGLLDEETRTICQNEVVSSSWYPLDVFTRFLEVEIRVLADGKEEMVTRGSEVIIEKQLRGIYKAFVKLGSPEFVIKRIAAVHATYFQGVPIEVQLQGHGKAVVRYTGFEKHHRIMGFAIMGFFKKALEISGAKDVVLCFTVPIEEGKAFSELSISWS